MPDILLLKLGGSLITDKARPETPRLEVISRLAGEIARAARNIPCRLIVGHGSGSFGHVAAQEHGIASGLSSPAQLPGISRTQERAAALHRQVIDRLLAAGVAPFSIAPSSCLIFKGGKPDLALKPLLLALKNGLMPVVYGDVVMDLDQGVAICSTERMLEILAHRLPVRRALWLGETDGVYDSQGQTIPRLSADGFEEALESIGSPAGTDVTGGMRHRVETALALTRLGIRSLLLNGLTPGLLERALLGEDVPGTAIE